MRLRLFQRKKSFLSSREFFQKVWPFSSVLSKVLLGCIHLFLVLGGVLFLLFQYSLEEKMFVGDAFESSTQPKHHVVLLELLDTYMRYEHYYKELYGRFTYDLRNLAVFHGFRSADLLYIEAIYEIYAVKSDDGSFTISAISKNRYENEKTRVVEKISLDERFQMKANFPIPNLSKAYLVREVYRILRQYSHAEKLIGGVSTSYLSFHTQALGANNNYRYVEGIRGGIKGNRYTINAASPIFIREASYDWKENSSDSYSLVLRSGSLVRRKIRFSREDFYAFLEEARFAQYVYEKETGHKASSWRELDVFFRFQFEYRAKRADNFSLEVLDEDKEVSLLAVRGTKGDLIGEYFSLGEGGELQRIQYSDIFIDRIRRANNLLKGNKEGFQIEELGREPALNSVGFESK